MPVPRIASDERWWTTYNTTASRGVGLRPDDVGTTRATLGFLSAVRALFNRSMRPPSDAVVLPEYDGPAALTRR